MSEIPWKCLLCDTKIPVKEIISGEHLRKIHPDTEEDFERWPDGLVVIYDDCPEAIVAADELI